MSRNEPSTLQKRAGQWKHRDAASQTRSAASGGHTSLGSALVQLIQEKPIDEVTVHEVLDRASVGRSTFYVHFRGTDDLLLSQLERFLEP